MVSWRSTFLSASARVSSSPAFVVELPARCSALPSDGEVHPVRPRRDRRVDVVMHRDGSAMAPAHRDQRPQQFPPLVGGEVLLA